MTRLYLVAVLLTISVSPVAGAQDNVPPARAIALAKLTALKARVQRGAGGEIVGV
ncbi:MAG: hypothetical protein ISS78_10550, partial [Phycisphaerae bacterium]|nr:hypothetical protein [Phycisphaerae bacterium]